MYLKQTIGMSLKKMANSKTPEAGAPQMYDSTVWNYTAINLLRDQTVAEKSQGGLLRQASCSSLTEGKRKLARFH